MATIKVLSSGAFQIRVVSKLLPKPFYATFDTREQAVAYSDQLKVLLAQGIVPATLAQEKGVQRSSWTLQRCIAEYLRSQSLPVSEEKLLDTIRVRIADVDTNDLNYEWVEMWIRKMKHIDNLSPNTIRHRHGALARCIDWVCRRHPQILLANPLRLLKRGFATYTAEDAALAAANGGKTKVDIERNRRLDTHEEARILACLSGSPDASVFFVLALETAMRMRECYTLGSDQVSLTKKTIHLDRTKNGDGRQVPLSSTITRMLGEYTKVNANEIAARSGRVFPFWAGDISVRVLDAATVDVSLMFRDFFRLARVNDFHFHDIRHEAICRLYEKTNLSDVLIARITGHRNLRMLQRYASLRGSDLAAHRW